MHEREELSFFFKPSTFNIKIECVGQIEVADTGISELEGMVPALWHSYGQGIVLMPLHTYPFYVFVVRVEDKIHIEHTACHVQE